MTLEELTTVLKKIAPDDMATVEQLIQEEARLDREVEYEAFLSKIFRTKEAHRSKGTFLAK